MLMEENPSQPPLTVLQWHLAENYLTWTLEPTGTQSISGGVDSEQAIIIAAG